MRVLGQMVMGLALIGAHPAMSQSTDVDSGNAYLPHCRAVLGDNPNAKLRIEDYLSQGRCMGVVSAMIGVGNSLAPEYRYCFPNGVNTGQGIRVVISYLDTNPSQLHYDFRFLVLRAFTAAWPCK
jgi:Ssp1 endopeptidase immunity protein Rap1a